MTNIFDRYADNYSESIDRSLRRFGTSHKFFAAHKAQVLLRLVDRHGMRVQDCRIIDVGCGTGMLHAHITGQFASVEGIDSSKESLRAAAEAFPMNCYRHYSGGRLPYEDSSFDVALAAAVFHHVAPGERMVLAKEMLRILCPGGLVIVVEHNPFNPITRYIVNTCELDKDAIMLRPAELRRLFTSAGAHSTYTRTMLSVPPVNELMFKVDEVFGYLPLGAQYYMVAWAPPR